MYGKVCVCTVGMNGGRKMRTIHKEEVGEGSMNIKYEQKTENEYYRQSMNTNYTVCIMMY